MGDHLCSSCSKKILEAAETISICLEDEIELEGGVSHPIEDIEELRLTFKSFLKKDILDSILNLYKELSKEPAETEMYSWFVRNSQFGGQCKFAIQALTRFKKNRLDKLEEQLRTCLASVEQLRKS